MKIFSNRLDNLRVNQLNVINKNQSTCFLAFRKHQQIPQFEISLRKKKIVQHKGKKKKRKFSHDQQLKKWIAKLVIQDMMISNCHQFAFQKQSCLQQEDLFLH